MRSLKNFGMGVLTAAMMIGGVAAMMTGVDKMQEKAFIVGDPLSEHIAGCGHCSVDGTTVVDCPVAVELQRARLAARHAKRGE